MYNALSVLLDYTRHLTRVSAAVRLFGDSIFLRQSLPGLRHAYTVLHCYSSTWCSIVTRDHNEPRPLN